MCEIFNIIGGDRASLRIDVRGIVQGVGFRPFVHRLVERHGLMGWVRNSPQGAELELEGGLGSFPPSCASWRRRPRLWRSSRASSARAAGRGAYSRGFRIVPSERGEKMRTLVSPDAGICPDCLRELLTPGDRRYRYPFINCTNCGPRFTIIRSVPYDRAYTSMSEFSMCPDCAAEFADIRKPALPRAAGLLPGLRAEYILHGHRRPPPAGGRHRGSAGAA